MRNLNFLNKVMILFGWFVLIVGITVGLVGCTGLEQSESYSNFSEVLADELADAFGDVSFMITDNISNMTSSNLSGWLWADGSSVNASWDLLAGILYGYGTYLRIGDASTTSHSLSSEDDLLVTGKTEHEGTAYFDGASQFNVGVTFNSWTHSADDARHEFGDGGDSGFLYETADGNAKAMVICLPHVDEDPDNVPVVIFGDNNIEQVDLGFFNGITRPEISVIDADRDSWFSFGYRAGDDAPTIKTNKAFYLQVSGDSDDYFKADCNSNIPTWYGVGAYTRFGDASITSHSLDSEDDTLFTGETEFDSNVFFDGYLYKSGSDLTIFNDTENKGMWLCNQTSGSGGSYMTLQHSSSSPTQYDRVGVVDFVGKDSVGDDVGYGEVQCRIYDSDNESENGEFRWYLIDDGVDNLAMYLSSNGTLSLDAGSVTFDIYDDAELLREGISNDNKQVLIDAGVLEVVEERNKVEVGKEPIIKMVVDEVIISEGYVNYWETDELNEGTGEYEVVKHQEVIEPVIEYVEREVVVGYEPLYEDVYVGEDYHINLQAMVNLLAGGVYQNRDKIDDMQLVVDSLMERIKVLEGGK